MIYLLSSLVGKEIDEIHKEVLAQRVEVCMDTILPEVIVN
jgi:hypothetical protein